MSNFGDIEAVAAEISAKRTHQPDFPMFIIALRIGFVSREKENLCLNQNVNYMRHADEETERETASPVQNRTGGLRNLPIPFCVPRVQVRVC